MFARDLNRTQELLDVEPLHGHIEQQNLWALEIELGKGTAGGRHPNDVVSTGPEGPFSLHDIQDIVIQDPKSVKISFAAIEKYEVKKGVLSGGSDFAGTIKGSIKPTIL